MSGHSKWSKVKHQKESSDAKKGQAFTKVSRALLVAIRDGGGQTNPEKNYRLRLAIEKARSINMPKETIERAMARAAGEKGEAIESVVYEGYGPGGGAVLVHAATDNRQRTVAEVKNIFERSGGSLATPGAVAYLFRRAGLIAVAKEADSAIDQVLELALEIGADDVVEQAERYEIYTGPEAVEAAKEKLLIRGLMATETGLVMRPAVTVSLDEGLRQRFAKLIGELKELDDVWEVYTNVAHLT